MSNITLTIPNDDHIALRAFGKALEEMALAHGAEPVGEMTYKIDIDSTEATAALERLRAATEELQQAAPRMMQEARFDGEELQGKRKEPEIDTTAQQVESLVERVDTMLEVAEQPFQGEVVPTTDSTGTPWDERIHSASKALNADGTWRLRRKPKDMDEAEWATLVESVREELAHAMESFDEQVIMEEDSLQPPLYEIAPGHIGVMQPEPPVTPPGDDFHTDTGVVTEQTVAGIPPLPVPPPVVVPPAPVDDVWTFPKLMTFLTERQGKIDVATVNMLLAQDGIASLPELNAHPDKIGPFVARVKAHLGE